MRAHTNTDTEIIETSADTAESLVDHARSYDILAPVSRKTRLADPGKKKKENTLKRQEFPYAEIPISKRTALSNEWTTKPFYDRQ